MKIVYFCAMEVIMEESWQLVLQDELQKSYMKDLMTFLETEYKNNTIFPPQPLIFEAFNRTPFHKVKVVILGQDPYHKLGQSHGLAFSVPPNISIPPSLRNIYKSLKNDFENFEIPLHGNLSYWAEQGVLLLNTTLTVREGQAGSHQKKGWEKFTNHVIHLLSDKKQGLVFLLWGKPAQEKEKLIDTTKHCILKSVHPSPLSAHRGFLENKHFSKANQYLVNQGKSPIDWQIPSIP